MEFIWIGKQKVVWFPKFRENLKEAAANVLMNTEFIEKQLWYYKCREGVKKVKAVFKSRRRRQKYEASQATEH
jgi:DNA-binding transcriptional regulator/RsmH inhibitor MraZ